MERSGNFYKAIRLGYILISILIGCMAYNSLYEWQEIEALELGNKKIDELRWKSHATLTLLAKQDLPTFGYNMIDPLKSWCWGSILFYPFKISRFS